MRTLPVSQHEMSQHEMSPEGQLPPPSWRPRWGLGELRAALPQASAPHRTGSLAQMPHPSRELPRPEPALVRGECQLSWPYLAARCQRGLGMVPLVGQGPALRLQAVLLQQPSVRPSVQAQPEFHLAGDPPRAGWQQWSRWPWSGRRARAASPAAGAGMLCSFRCALRGRCEFSGCGPGRCIYTLVMLARGAARPPGLAGLSLAG